MVKENIKNQIIDVDGYVYIVNGKVICFESDVYDLHNLKHVEELLYLSLRMGSDDEDDKFYYGGYGDNTILFLDRNPDNPVELTETMGSLRYMPEDVQKKCKLAVLKQKNQIIDIDGYVHVVNGRVICFKPDVYDLDNPRDVQNVFDTVVSLFGSDGKLRVWFDDNTFVVLERSDVGNVVVGMGDVLCLPKAVQEKVRDAVNEYRGAIGN